jgi:hypothetical protein
MKGLKLLGGEQPFAVESFAVKDGRIVVTEKRLGSVDSKGKFVVEETARYRTSTEWGDFHGKKVPVKIYASARSGEFLKCDFKWVTGESVPDSIFQFDDYEPSNSVSEFVKRYEMRPNK